MCACTYVHIHRGSVPDMLDHSLIGFLAPETLNSLTRGQKLRDDVCVCGCVPNIFLGFFIVCLYICGSLCFSKDSLSFKRVRVCIAVCYVMLHAEREFSCPLDQGQRAVPYLIGSSISC